MPKDKGFNTHFPKNVSKEIQNYIRDKVLEDSRYLFTHKQGSRQYAFCTHCRVEHESKGLKHGDSSQCPSCKSLVWVKSSGRGRKSLLAEAYLLWYEKSKKNKNVIIARGFYIKRDYTRDYRKTETLIKPIALYVFEYGVGGRMMNRDYWTYYGETKWSECSSVFSEATRSMSNKFCYHAKHSIDKAVQGTPFQYSTWEMYDHKDMVEFFDLAARYKCIEFLTKAGLGCFVNTKLRGGATFGAVNWNGKTPEKVLRLTKSEIKEMRKAGAIGLQALRHYQILKKEGPHLNWEDTRALSDLIDKRNDLRDLTRHASIQTIKLYFARQMHRPENNYNNGGSVLIAWRDYLRECGELGIDISRESILFPNSLYKAHQSTMKLIKVANDEKTKAQLAAREKELQTYCFEFNNLFIRPASSGDELSKEGKALSHCVGGYASKYARGNCDIFFIRKKSKPDNPFYTMEIVEGQIVQCQGYDHCLPTPEVQKFIDAFKKVKLTNKKSKTKKKTKLNKQEEVAV